ncbi:MAG: hypothetical protein BWY91_03326 [bacterium ADurb.BinA028]|nr:MAG: hypothetical protein BWY91_03326 [bacterium ADurb.BinA028]
MTTGIPRKVRLLAASKAPRVIDTPLASAITGMVAE